MPRASIAAALAAVGIVALIGRHHVKRQGDARRNSVQNVGERIVPVLRRGR